MSASKGGSNVTQIADVFISYATEDRDAARRIAQQLEHAGWSVWWDRRLIPGSEFSRRIQDELEAASSVVVLWSGASVESDWVAIEAGYARGHKKLVPALIEEVAEKIPLEFARIHSARLVDWDGAADDPELQSLISAVGAVRPATGRTPPDRPQPGSEEPEGVPGAALAIEILGAALLLLGTSLRADSFLHPDFGPGNAPNLGFFTSLAPIGVVLAAFGALALSHTGWPRGLSLGLVLGCGLVGSAKYVGVLGLESATGESEPRLTLGATLALIGSLMLVAVASWRAFAELRERPAAGPPVSLSVALVALGAGLTVAGTLIPFNDGPEITEQTLIERADHWEAFEPIAVAVLAVVAGVLLAGRGNRLLVAGVLVALGTLSAVLWLRYVAVPILQPDTISSPAAGAFIGLAGSGLILVGGAFAAAGTHQGFAGSLPAGRAT